MRFIALLAVLGSIGWLARQELAGSSSAAQAPSVAARSAQDAQALVDRTNARLARAEVGGQQADQP